MLNPKLFEEFGDSCKLFFEKLHASVGDDLFDKCYAISGIKVESGNLVGPLWVAVDSDELGTRKVRYSCINLSLELRDDSDCEREPAIYCIPYSDERSERDAIKVWVN